VLSKFISCVTARTGYICLSPSPFTVTYMAEKDRRKHYTLLDFPSLSSIKWSQICLFLMTAVTKQNYTPFCSDLQLIPRAVCEFGGGQTQALHPLGFALFMQYRMESNLFIPYDCSNKTELHAILFRLPAHSSRCL
jgi:hypothetical protein